MDKYDYMILDIIQTYKQEQQAHIRLAVLERNFWKRIEADTDLSVGQARIGERITNLYLDGMLQNKNGYTLTKKVGSSWPSHLGSRTNWSNPYPCFI